MSPPRRRVAGRSSSRPRPAGGAKRAGGPRAGDHRALGGDQIEGRQAVREALLAGRRKVHEVWVLEESDELARLARDLRVPVRVVGRGRLDGAARSESPQGVLARAAPLPETDLEELLRARPGERPPFLVAVDGVTDPGNLGAVLRSAECAGATGAVLARHRAVHVTPTVAKAAAGAVEHLPLSVVPGLPNALSRVKEAGVWVVGLDAGGDVGIDALDVATGPVLLVVGAEGAGLSPLVRRRCDVLASIPLAGRIESLNVAAAAAVACFAVAQQRRRARSD